MADCKADNVEPQEFFENLWRQGDPWELETSEYDQTKYARELTMIGGRRYSRVLEVGCGAGQFTRGLSSIADHILALDIAPSAIEKAREAGIANRAAEFRVANIMDGVPRKEGPWDLIVMSETVYCLGWAYSFFQLGWLAAELFTATSPGGRFLMTNTNGSLTGPLLRPWLIRTYRDLFINVGFRLESEEVFRGSKHGIELEALLSLFIKDVEGATGKEIALW